jgi:hypothetical protein
MEFVWRQWGAVIVAFLLALPLGALIAVTRARHLRASGLPAARAWRFSLAEVGMVVGTLPWLWMVFTPRPGPSRRVYSVPLTDLAGQFRIDGAGALVQIVGNLLVFAALGFCAPIRFTGMANLPRVLLLGAAGSVLIETSQFVFALGRVSSVDDVLLNALGAMLAAFCSRRWWARSPVLMVRRQ